MRGQILGYNTIFSLFGDRFEETVKLDRPPRFQDLDNPYIYILGFSSVNGIICLYNDVDYDNTTTMLWNPATGEFKTIPLSLQAYENIEFNIIPDAFGYDSIRYDYKVIHMLQYPHWLDFYTQMVSFDFINEKFFATTLPSLSDPYVIYKSIRNELMMLNRSVALICNYDYMNYFHIWILGEFGVKESWTKLFVFGALTCVHFPIGA
ncbi:unnamed protein product [Vicia faba]|uniref:F-box associated beta-propeller type 3 domain-containing protein n=1 Tax=Vicia faba TaxID=3906 RepID=A0AAV1AE63_VICFA|nr:unnamed protein product [Vicia faba]